MFKLWSNSVVASEIAEFLGRKLQGPDIAVYGPRNLSDISDNSLICLPDDDAGALADAAKHQEVFALLSRLPKKNIRCSFIVSANPALDFSRVIEKFFIQKIVPGIHPTAVIEKGAKLGQGVSVFANAHVGPEVFVGDHTVIHQNAVISGRVSIGANCVIKPNAVIGSDVFDFLEGDKDWKHSPQIGKIVIGDNVWIGANTTVEKGAFSDTLISSGAKIDDLVQIGHDTIIGTHSIIAAGAVLCGQVVVGNKCWIAPHTSVLQRIKIGDGAVVGLGAVVIEDVKAKTVVVGNPAKILGKVKKTTFQS